jgi:hypothetical protein
MHSETRRLSEFTAVVIAYDPGDSESAARYPVQVTAMKGKDFGISTPERFTESREQAEYLCRVLRLPLVDTTNDHWSAVNPDAAGDALSDRLVSTHLEAERVELPLGMPCEVSERDGKVTIVGGRSLPGAFAVLGPVVALIVVIAMLLRVFSQDWSSGTELTVLSVFLLILSTPAIIWCVNLKIPDRKNTILRASPAGLVIERRGLWRTRTTEVQPPTH